MLQRTVNQLHAHMLAHPGAYDNSQIIRIGCWFGLFDGYGFNADWQPSEPIQPYSPGECK